jgi:hypothetical protein
MWLGIKLEAWLTIVAIVVGPLLAFAVQHWRDKRREHWKQKVEVFRQLLLTLKVPMAQRHVDAINSIPLEFHSQSEIISAWRLYTSHLNNGVMLQQEPQRWGEKKLDLLVDLVSKIGDHLGYEHIDEATLRDNLYVPKGYSDVEEQWRQIREAWLQVLSGQRPMPMTMVGSVTVEQPMQLLQELPLAPALPPNAVVHPNDGQ